ncbi:MAG: glycoside hydrolase family 3 protein [Acidobacteria bacterium]|nr:glycoside hydrolase family 3 protein [Acidobacteriota bacterium]
MNAIRNASLSRVLFLRLKDNRWTRSLESGLRDSPPGGVLLADPLPRTPDDTLALTLKIRRACSNPVFIAIREEGGPGSPLSRYFAALPLPRALAKMGAEAVARSSDLMGDALRLLGLNTNFAPVLDLATPLSEKKLGARTFGRDPQGVAECGGALMCGLARHKILACGKHFPGWGSVPFERASGLPVSAKTMASLWREDLLPFRKLLPWLPMVLLSSAAYKAYDFDLPRPASLSSSVVEGLLRGKLGYHGVALAFDLDSKDVRGALSFGEAVIQSLNAGCDMVMVDQGERFGISLEALKTGIQSGRLSTQRVEEALKRIQAAQKRIPSSTSKPSKKAIQGLQKGFDEFSREFIREESSNG